jgi:hypothetical protein
VTSKKITNLANGKPCTVRLPLVCNRNTDTTVFAHYSSIRLGHGVGIKTLFGAFCCSDCHDAIDGRAKTSFTRDYLRLAHADGVIETLLDIRTNHKNVWESFLL